jgi:hypothetical protein
MEFPVQQLEAKGISESGVRFIKRLMKADAGSRLTADQAQKAAWVTADEEKDWEYVEIDSDAELTVKKVNKVLWLVIGGFLFGDNVVSGEYASFF